MSSKPEQSPQPDSDAEQLELKLPDESSAPKDLGLWAGVLVLLTLIAYWQSTSGSFVWRDDRLAQAHWLLEPGGLSLAWFGRWENPDTYTLPLYQPAALTAYWLEYRAGGHNDQGLPSPMAYHVASLIFHAVAGVVLWLVLREMLIPGAWIIAAIFALHPIHSEPISWISEQGTVLAGMFFIGSIYCYLMFIKWRQRDIAERAQGGEGVDPAQTWGLFAGAVVLFLLANLSDPSAVVLPLVLLLLLWWRKQVTSLDGLLITPMVVIAAALWISTADIHHNQNEPNLLHSDPVIKAAMIGRGVWFSLSRLVAPVGFSVLDFPASPLGPAMKGFFVSIAAFVLLAITVLLVMHLMRRKPVRGLLTALAIFFLLICGSPNWFDTSRLSPSTDCVAYLAIVPIVALLVVFISRLKLPGPHPQSAVAVCAVVLLAFGLLSWMRTHAFDNPISLWRDVVRKDPGNSFAMGSLAEQLRLSANDDFAGKNLDEMNSERADAKEFARQAAELDRTDARPQRTWANVLVESGDVSAALPHFRTAIALNPNSPSLRTEYAAALILLGRFDKETIDQLDAALVADPTSSTAHELLGEAYAGQGKTERAVKEFERALELNNGDFTARQKLAEIQARIGTPDELKKAADNYALILSDKIQRESRADIWLAVAQIKRRQGDLDNAMGFLKTAAGVAKEDPKMLEKIDAEVEQVKRLAATRPSTLPSTRGTTLPTTTR